MSIEKKVELMWNFASNLKGNSQTHKLLKSYYINTSRKLSKNNLQIPKEKFAVTQMCRYCSSFWSETEFSLKLVPKQLSNNSKAIKLVEALEQNKDTVCKNLNKKKRNRAKWLKKRLSNYMAIKCELCKRRSLLKLESPKNKTNKKFDVEREIEKEFLTDKKQNKSKLLRLEENKINNKEHSKCMNKKKKATKVNHQKNAMQRKKVHSTSQSKKNKNVANLRATEKVTSKTQKQNSILQLAALLQKQSQSENLEKGTQRLDLLLK